MQLSPTPSSSSNGQPFVLIPAAAVIVSAEVILGRAQNLEEGAKRTEPN